MSHRRTFAYAADDELAIYTFEQSVKIVILRGVLADNSILNAYAHAIVKKSRHHVKSCLFICSKIVLFLEINHQPGIRRFGNFAIAALDSHQITRVCTRQHHHAGKLIFA